MLPILYQIMAYLNVFCNTIDCVCWLECQNVIVSMFLYGLEMMVFLKLVTEIIKRISVYKIYFFLGRSRQE